MEIIKINPRRIENKKIDYVVKFLKKGKAVVLPTDTSYGLAVNALNENAVEKLYKIKNKPRSKPISIFIRNITQIGKYAEINEVTKKLFNKYFPGPITLIVPKKNNLLSKMIISKKNVSFRIPNNKIIIKILEKIHFPITGTSANITKGKEPYSINEILKQYKNKKLKPDLVVDAGVLKKIKPSTIVDLTGKDVKLSRKGPIKFKDVINTLKS